MHRILSILLIGWLTACTGANPDQGPQDLAGGAADIAIVGDLTSPGDLASSGDLNPSACIGKASCDCRTSPACQPIGTVCYCPTECGIDCVCGGGSYLGCAPKASGCASTVACRPAGRPGPQDQRGCFDCVYPATCETAAASLRDGCPGKRTMLTALSCDKAPECVTRCINAVNSCSDIGCGFCAACGCAALGPFEQCVLACLK